MTNLFLYLFPLNTISFGIDLFLMHMVCACFDDCTVAKKKKAVIYIVTSILLGCTATLFTIGQIQTNNFFLFSNQMLFYFLVINIVQTIVLKVSFKRVTWPFLFLLVTIISALSDLCSIMTENLSIYSRGFDMAATYMQKAILRLPFLVLTFVLLYAVIWLCRKTDVIYIMEMMMNHSLACFLIASVMISSKLVSLKIFGVARADSSNNYSLYFLLMAVVIVMVILLIRAYISEIKRNEMRLLLGQQTDYLKRLEEIQKKLRIIHHDYKNVAAGLYLIAEVGDREAVRNYVNKQLLMLDGDIQIEICQINQLINIKHTELKSLFITKIALAAEENVTIDIEIADPVQNVNMPTRDLLRCLGILLDNAVEGAAHAADKVVNVLIVQADQVMSILIKNQINEAISLNQIFKAGYSSKGAGRGLGLYSLKETLRKHQNIYLETKLEEEWFVQIIKIK